MVTWWSPEVRIYKRKQESKRKKKENTLSTKKHTINEKKEFLSFFRFLGRERVFFLSFFLDRKHAFLLFYFLVFFYKFPPQSWKPSKRVGIQKESRRMVSRCQKIIKRMNSKIYPLDIFCYPFDIRYWKERFIKG